MKMRMTVVTLWLLTGLNTGQAQLKVDFTQAGGPVEAGYQGYFASHEVAATFTAQSFAAFDTVVTITPTWAAGATPQAMQMIDRGGNDGTDTPDLLRDWVGTDGRQPGDPMTLTLRGLPAGTYDWLSYHHDPEDQTGVFSVTVNDAAGAATTADIDISDTRAGAIVNLADVTKFTTTIISNGVDDVTLIFDLTSATAPVSTAFFLMNAFELTSVDTGQALLPVPAHGATDVSRDGAVLSWTPSDAATAHDVYLGTDHDDIDDGTTASAVYQGRQSANSVDLGRLEFGQTYYWRVDEVLTDGTVVKGAVWNFTVEPVSTALAGARITATASSSNSADEGPDKTIDGSGLDADDQHSADTKAMWLSGTGGGDAAWIQYEFDRVYLLDQMLVWNHNTEVESLVGFGVKAATVDYSLDGIEWTTLDPQEFAQAPGAAGYRANTTVEFGGAAARYVRITVHSNWGGVLQKYGLSEVRFLVIPAFARHPVPADEATGVDPRSVLNWRAGREAAVHKVYVSTDVNEVINGTALAGTVSEPSFDADGMLALGQTYYWKVDEVNDAEDPTIWAGDVWSFSTSAFLSVDDMESYDDQPEQGTRIYETWLDGWDVPTNGSQVGHDSAPFAEQTIIHGGLQSMPLHYDNSTASYSEAARTFDEPQDWTQYGAKGLTLWFYGDASNTAGQMYVKVNGRKVAYDGDADNLLRKPWQMWYIDLSSLTGINLKKVSELTIGFEGGKGLVFIDDIALSPQGRELVTPTEPGAAGLVAHYAFEGNVDDSTGTHPGTVTGAPQYVPGKVGQAIKLDGARDYVLVESSFDLPVYSAAVWFRVDGGTGERDVLSIYDSVGAHGVLLEVRNNSALRFLHRAPLGTSGGTDIYSNDTYTDGAWYHAALIKSADTVTLYVNGAPAGSAADTTEFGQALQRLTLGVLKHDNLARYFPGALDEVYLYDRALSPDEVAWLAGRTKPFDKP